MNEHVEWNLKSLSDLLSFLLDLVLHGRLLKPGTERDGTLHNFPVIKVTGYRVGVVVSRQLQPPVATALLLSLSWKQHSVKTVILASIARAKISTTCVDVHVRRLPPRNFSHQNFHFVWKIQCRRLRSLCAVATSSTCRKLFCLAFSVRKKGGN